ncbi:uncharacterized protein LOC130101820 [Rhinichthys klamathensis goyatoka]|uniref:uncharacterized protein LOC130079378 n=1 Tax=Rhinichthys klamathensis goyatoka TaxID=3034132 RepID=UPI0024B52ED4|nr:uncharacterized protein LOC130079378 [Rhinichthys klamathensis goyatoka]XP_056123649.1 uncharacterized protein LOC130101820 [Rhinichthys klamathensis goyatoka]
MDSKAKQWSVEETNCLLAIWSSAEVQQKIEGASRTKHVFEEIQREMAAAGFNRTIEQINNKLKKLKKDYRDQKKELGRSGNGRPRSRNTHFEVLDSVLGDRPACQVTGALNSTTVMLESMVVDETLLQGIANNVTDSELLAIDDCEPDRELPLPLHCSSPVPSCSSAAETSSSSSSSRSTRKGKRKRDMNGELLEYFERSDERFLQHCKDMNDTLLRKLDADSSAMLGLMERMVTVMERQPH